MKVNQIFGESIYVRGASNHLSSDDKAAAIRSLGITHVINLWSRADSDLIRLVPNYWHHPMADGRGVPPWLLGLSQAAAEAIRGHGARFLIQCHAGRNRSCLLATMIVWALTGMEGEACLDFVREKRRDAVDNDFFQVYLEMLPPFTAKAIA